MEKNKSEVTWVDRAYLLLETLIHIESFKDNYISNLEITKLKSVIDSCIFCKTEDIDNKTPGELMYDPEEDYIGYMVENNMLFEITVNDPLYLDFIDSHSGRHIKGTDNEVVEYKLKLQELDGKP